MNDRSSKAHFFAVGSCCCMDCGIDGLTMDNSVSDGKVLDEPRKVFSRSVIDPHLACSYRNIMCLVVILFPPLFLGGETAAATFHHNHQALLHSSSSSSFFRAPWRKRVQIFRTSLEQEISSLSASNRHDPVIDDTNQGFTCHFCKASFVSRNAVFRHLRTDGCSLENPRNPGDVNDTIVKQSIAVLFGYVTVPSNNSGIPPLSSSLLPVHLSSNTTLPLNEWAGLQVYETLRETIDKFGHQQATEGEKDNGKASSGKHSQQLDFRLQQSRTQSTMAKLRSSILAQEDDCAAANDVLIVTGTCLESTLPELENVLSYLPHTIVLTNDTLTKDAETNHGSNVSTTNTNSKVSIIRIWKCKLLSPDVTLHAERSCTQLVYHYLVPLSWLPDSQLLIDRWGAWNQKPPTDSLRRFKAALRNAESSTVAAAPTTPKKDSDDSVDSNDTNTRTIENPRMPKVAAGRFGRLGAKERRAWHNFADPTLRGQASPNQEPIWRVVDFCRMLGMLNFGTEDAALVIEVKGDAFLPQQVRRIIGTALAMTHGWMQVQDHTIADKDIWDQHLLNPASVIETILAPPGRLYLAGARFHFEESRTSGIPFFDSDICGNVLHVGEGQGVSTEFEWTQRLSLQSRASNSVRRAEQEWLEGVRDYIAPRIGEMLQRQDTLPRIEDSQSLGTFDPAPSEYKRVLEKLREIAASGRWPDTSVARSSVIRGLAKHEGKESRGKAGSFTVVNTSVLQDKLQQKNQDPLSVPLGNQLFPDLVSAVFDLERAISANARKVEVTQDGNIRLSSDFTSRRPVSTHCAINCNAQFLPHVDSGRGQGQSLSLIAGLGDYRKGELLVEGQTCDIRYNPLEFDGWKMRHWTNLYEGERFSLVWFTPEISTNNCNGGSKEDSVIIS